jgi:ribose/xylose/arabinose/galactoside ABC-type transport system permease subunit
VERVNSNKTYDLFYKYGLYIVLIALVVIFTYMSPKFLSVNNGINLLQQSVTLSIAACGMVFVLIQRGIDLSMGSVMYFTAVLVTLATNAGLGIVGAFALSIAIGAGIGAVNGFFVAKAKVDPLIVTLSTMYIVRGLGIVIGGTGLIYFNNAVSDTIVFTRIFDVLPVLVIILAITMFVAQFMLTRSRYGRQLFAIGNNATAAKVTGIAVDRGVFLSYVICGATAGLAGLVSGAQVGGISSTNSTGAEFMIISAAVLGGVSLFGGKGSAFPGAFIGVLIIMVIENGLVMAQTDMYLFAIIRGIIIFVAVMLDCMRNKEEHR